jgi:ubiquinone/menaquinone biosynthesis C-methylase UbiE
LNIARLPNADVVGDAERLPIAANSIDAVYCEAVFEHLENPELAATEMFRVLKPGSVSFVCTPFMQAFHGYPSARRFQDFRKRHLRRAAWAVTDMVDLFITQYGPRLIRLPARAVWRGFARLFIRPLDKWLGARKDSYAMASTTYVLITKP